MSPAPIPVGSPVMRFNGFALLPEARVVLVGGEPAHVGARAFDLLHALASRPGQIVDKRELLQRVWPDTVVEENNLQVQVCALRKLLGPRTIVTVPGRGYGFAAPVELVDASQLPLSPASAAPRPATGRPGNVNSSSTPLHGRIAELAALGDMLRAQRLVTLVGPGGVGKSRLAQAATGDLATTFTDGVWFVELAPMSQRVSIAAAAARVMGVGAVGRGTPHAQHAQLAQALRGRRLLIVLENCEHLTDAAGEFAAALLAHAPQVHVLAVSQVPLKLRGEHLLRIAPLEVPHTDDDTAPAPAIGLFSDAVSAFDPGKPLKPQQRPDALAICRHLDGLPLALELAASRVPMLGLSGLRRRLADRFHVLSADTRGGSPRHRSLLASLEWSWALLTAHEQEALAAVARFKGRFTLRMAQRALGLGSAMEWEALETLSALADKSMLMMGGGTRRDFHLLESTRLFVLERGILAQEAAAPFGRIQEGA